MEKQGSEPWDDKDQGSHWCGFPELQVGLYVLGKEVNICGVYPTAGRQLQTSPLTAKAGGKGGPYLSGSIPI